MTIEEREEHGDRIARWVSERVHEATPAGLGRWEPAWEIVEAPSNAFLDALKAWEQSGALEDQRRVQEAGRAVVEAWRDAGAQWERVLQSEGHEVAA
jgi:hypothetical protein